jgi:hypothetical protein
MHVISYAHVSIEDLQTVEQMSRESVSHYCKALTLEKKVVKFPDQYRLLLLAAVYS